MPLVLVTGATGFFAQLVLDSLLEDPAGYRVRGTLRSKAKADALLARFSAEQQKRIELVEVADTASSDLSDAVKGVDAILHTASPYQLNVEDAERDLLKPALEGTLNVLRYAAKESSVKFIGITSSFAAVTNFEKGGPNRPGFVYTDKDWNPAGAKEAIQFGGAGAFSYSASKKIAEEAAWKFVESEKPGFAITSFNPPMIYGPTKQPNVTLSNINTSSKTIYGLISNAEQMPEDRLPLFCHARDVADAHVRAIANKEAHGKRFLLCGGKFNWTMAVQHIAQTRPELKSRLPRGWENAESKPVSQYASLDTKPAEQILGMQFKQWQQTLDESLDSLLELEKQADWK
ncbi:unnamed protein product [Parajaminaea phylloscopi]